ncbi:hypothetical protein ASPSYDRAFT_1138402 [Aspergillus sydowii CBS 593.65]|uniref:Zn(2)-C6 fungal-type domain-containing protein n=1 Tax=Aspergillus sydowii CBS 593.65 TaxID=1036612 RepID=A0A1L9TAF6_9EURO|nr:uncharacterized protein ASPSYDRAFT_1138402 [Aspergillus sydowii CBS 593.65]OJJ56427.1 hypothetical protein ASPSYDRAFT_1138402 [Aspergillus sydowii CBS 593.65]
MNKIPDLGQGGHKSVPPRPRRMKYAKEACSECKRRKIKCSGERPCRGCASSASRVCAYNRPQRDNRRIQHIATRHSARRSLEGINHAASADHYSGLGRPFTWQMDIDRLAVPDRQLFIGHEDAYQSFLPTKQNGIGQDAQFSRLKSVLSGLKAEPNLGLLLKYCFDELEFFYPCVNRQDFYNRLFQMLPSASSDNDEEISHKVRPAEYRALAALVCRMLSIAAFLGAGAGPQERLQGDDHYVKASLSWHVESQKLLADSSANDEVSFDAIRAYLLEVIYMTMVQRPRGASQAIAIAIDLSFSIRLHDEQTWTADTPTETEHFRQLWWTVFHLDRRVAFMIGRPYIAVDLSIKRLAYVLDEVNAARHSSIETPLGGGSLYGDYRTDDIWSGYWELERGLLQGQ